ncbi:MAG: murein biosynthesis integral membrane protein MurJ [Anaerolineae bacterium]
MTDQAGGMPSRLRQVAFSTALVMVIFGTTKLISLVQTFIIARYFGVGRELDAYVTANRVPELIVVLISGGALGHAFIPIFSGYLARQDRDGAWRLASMVINAVLTAALLISGVVFVLTPWLVPNIIAPGFAPATTEQTIVLMRILLLGTIIFSISGIFSGILQSHNHFLLPALAPIMYDIGILFGVVVLLQPFGLEGVAVGTVLGAAMHLLIQVPGLVRHRMRWQPIFEFGDPQLRTVVKRMIPRILGLGVFQMNFLVMTNIASRLGEGAVSAFDWGWRLMQIPQTLIGTAMGIVIFPTLAALSATGDDNGKRLAMSSALRFILVASIPSAIGLIVVGQPLVSLLEGGAFDATASALVYSTLRAFTLGLIVHSMLEVVARSFYADGDTYTPLWAALVGAAVNLVLSFTLSGVAVADAQAVYRLAQSQIEFTATEPIIGNVSGLALANSLGTAVEVGILLVLLRLRWHGIEEGTLAATTVRALAASLVMALVLALMQFGWVMLGIAGRGTIITALLLGAEVVVGAGVFFGAGWLLGMQELRLLVQLLRERLVRRTVAIA